MILWNKIKRIVFLFFLMLIIGFSGYRTNRVEAPKAINGFMDLKNWNFEKNGLLKLNGQWEIYWGSLLEPKDFQKENTNNKIKYINLPNVSLGKTTDEKKLEPLGFGTLRLVINLKENPNIDYSLRVFRILSASKIWVNGHLVNVVGVVSDNPKLAFPNLQQNIESLDIESDTVEIIIQTSSLPDLNAPFKSLVFGKKSDIFKDYFLDISRDLFIFGSLFFMGIYHLALYYKRKKDKSALFLGLTAFLIAFRTILTGTRLIYSFYPNLDWEVFNKMCYLSIYMVVPIYYMFLKEIFNKIHKNFLLINNIIMSFFVLITIFTPYYDYFLIYFEILSIIGLLYILIIIAKETINKNEYANLFFIGLIVIVICSINDSLISIRAINFSSMLPFGFFVFMLLQAYMLASKFSDAFVKAEALTEEIKGLNNDLEVKVEIRTKELSDTLEVLKKSQEKIIESEKMAALGQLIAGIAHEINTPLGAIRASIGNISDSYKETITKLPNLIKEISFENLDILNNLIALSNKSTKMLMGREARKVKKIHNEFLEKNEIENSDYIADILIDMGIEENIEFLLPLVSQKKSLELMNAARDLCLIKKNSKNIDIAVDKAAKVVYALKIYAHHEEAKVNREINILENIEVVLTLYNNQIKHGVEVIKEYVNVPNIIGFPDELNQVWTNIIYNAIQAMENKGVITIKVYEEDNFVKVKISDTGCGIPKENLEKIFEPFFTTKKMGEGTGLGLDIVKKIIDKHNGFIECDSILGEGTTFTVTLPIEKT